MTAHGNGSGGHDAPRGFWRRCVFSTDHKVIGIQYLATAVVMAVLAGGLAILIRLQLAYPNQPQPWLARLLPDAYPGGIMKPEFYLSLVTMHGTLMVFFVISMAFSGLGNFVIPLQVGARDMAYPFLNALSYWTVVPACLLMVASFFVEGGAASAGWTAYPPLSALRSAVPGSGTGQTLWILGMALFIASFTMGSLNFLVTILNLRARGMSMMRLPMTIWMFLVASILGILAFPSLTAAAIMLLLDRHAGTSFFLPSGMMVGGQILPNQGGTPLLFQHLFWFLGHPEVYILILPAIGIAFDVIAVFARRPPFGYRTSVYAVLAIALMSMIVWGHHMFTSGMNPWVGEYFTIVTVMITVPFAVLGLNLIGSLWRARIRFDTPMLFALGLVSAVGTGGLGGLYLGTSAADIFFHDSYFVVGHFHFMIGWVTFFGILTGVYYWFPKMTGRRMSERLGKIHFWLTFVAVYAVFVPMHYLGLSHHMRRIYDPTAYEFLRPVQDVNVFISWAGFAMGAAQLIFVVNVVWSLWRGERAARNPWDAATLEWTTESPAPHGNWNGTEPAVHRWPYDYRVPEAPETFVPQDAEPVEAGERP